MTTLHRGRILTTSALAATGLLLGACGSGSAATSSANSPPASGPHTTAAASTEAGTARSSAAAPAPAASPGGDACSLVTEQDATAAVGIDLGNGSPFSSHGSTQCQYGSVQTVSLIVNLTPAHGKAGYNAMRGDPKLHSGNGLSVADVPGVGDQAFEVSGPHNDALYFTEGDAIVVVGITSRSAPHHGAALALAKIAAGRL